jgi:hypothetical protein
MQFVLYFRCFYIGQSYAGAKKWKEAIGLFDRVLQYAQEAVGKYKKLPNNSVYKVHMC